MLEFEEAVEEFVDKKTELNFGSMAKVKLEKKKNVRKQSKGEVEFHRAKDTEQVKEINQVQKGG